MTEISQFGSFNQPYVVQKAPFTEPQVPTPKSYLLNQPIKDEVSFGNAQAPAQEQKSGGALKWVLGLAILGVGAYFLHGHFKGKGAKAAADTLTDAAKPGEKAAEATTKAEQVIVADAAKPATSEVKAHDFTIKYESEVPKAPQNLSSEVKAHDFTINLANDDAPSLAKANLPTAEPESVTGYKWQTKTTSPMTVEVVQEEPSLLSKIKSVLSREPKSVEDKAVKAQPAVVEAEPESVTGYKWQTKTTSPMTVEVVQEEPSLLSKVKALFNQNQKSVGNSVDNPCFHNLKTPTAVASQDKNRALVRGKNSLADEEQYLPSKRKGVLWSPWSKGEDKAPSGVPWSPWGKK